MYKRICRCGRELEFKSKVGFLNSESKNKGCNRCKGKSFLTLDNEKFLIEDYKNNALTCPKLAVKYNISITTVCKILHKSNVSFKPMSEVKRKYPINESFLDVIDTEEKAYFLGMMYADGSHNEKKKEFKVELQERDKDILDKFTQLIQPTKPLRYYIKSNEKHSNTYRFIVENKVLSESLSKLGCMQRKTFKIEFPLWLDQSLYKHFIRGYFDGDGHLSKNAFTIVGTREFLEVISEILQKELNLKPPVFYTRHPERNHNITEIRYNKSADIKILSDWLYKNANIYLDRKYNTYLEF